MGNCKCNCMKGSEEKSEMIYSDYSIQTPVPKNENLNNEFFPNINVDDPFQGETNPQTGRTANNTTINKNKKNLKNNPFMNNPTGELESIDSALITQNAKRDEIIFDLFNDIRINPKKFEEDAINFEVQDVLNSYIEEYESINQLIKNPFYNLLLNNSINNCLNSDGIEGLEESINKEDLIKDFEKKLFIIKARLNNPEEAVWNLIKENKNIAIKEILKKKIQYLIVSSYPIKNSEFFKVFYLFLIEKGE